MSRLTSVANVKRFLVVTTTGQDALIDRLIPTESALIEQWTSRRFGYTDRTKRINGTGTPTIVLPDQPIRAVNALTVGTVVQPASADGLKPGYVFDETSVSLIGAKFPQGLQNVSVSWSAGYRAEGNVTLPAPAMNAPTILVSVTDLTFDDDQFIDGVNDVGFPMATSAVSYSANGVTFTRVPTANVPLVGEYTFSMDAVWGFNTSDANSPVSILLDYAPGAVEQACIEMVGLDLKQRDNLGVSSRTIAGESVSYDKSGVPKSCTEMLRPYQKRTPG